MARYYYHGWTEEEERILSDVIMSGLRNREKIDNLIVEAAEKIGRTVSSCSNRWYGKNGIRHKYVDQMRKLDEIRLAR